MNIIAPYRSDESDKKHIYSRFDKVEREGFVSNEQKIEAFINQGMVLTEYHGTSAEYDIGEEESDFESDSPEFIDELTNQALEDSRPPLIQHLDKITALESLENAEKTIEESESRRKNKKTDVSDSEKVVNAIKEGFKAVSKEKNKTETPQA